MDIVRGDQWKIHRARQGDQFLVDRDLLFQAMILNLNEETFRPEDLSQ
jgi:hypothetical protein